jgi:hypothetical protein
VGNEVTVADSLTSGSLQKNQILLPSLPFPHQATHLSSSASTPQSIARLSSSLTWLVCSTSRSMSAYGIFFPTPIEHSLDALPHPAHLDTLLQHPIHLIWHSGIPQSEKVELKSLHMCLGCSNHTYSNNMINRCNV